MVQFSNQTVMSQQGEQQWTEHAALRGSSVQCGGAGETEVSQSGSPGSSCRGRCSVPAAQLLNQVLRDDCVECWTKVYEQHSYLLLLTQVTAPLNQPSCSPQRVPITQAHISQSTTLVAPNEASNDVVKALAEAITANRIPIPEPVVFYGDPLNYNDWKLSFQTVIDRKNLLAQKKLVFLRKYVSGQAKRAIEGHFLVGTETAYTAAWNILDDRFGNPFVVGKSYRDKIQSWHKIATKETQDLREFVDFLSSDESAVPYVQGLQALNDCVISQIARMVAFTLE
ncbi:uncharacterized protein LOC113048957, partial [Tachysurus ichikawai]